MNTPQREPDPPGRRPWATPALEFVGYVGDLLQGGSGKLSPSEGDPGDVRKVPGGEPH